MVVLFNMKQLLLVLIIPNPEIFCIVFIFNNFGMDY